MVIHKVKSSAMCRRSMAVLEDIFKGHHAKWKVVTDSIASTRENDDAGEGPSFDAAPHELDIPHRKSLQKCGQALHRIDTPGR